MRSTVVAGIGGLVVGHIVWLVAISLAIATSAVNHWVLVASALFFLCGAAAVWLGWRMHRRRSDVWAAFLCCLPISPILLSLSVLGVTYL
ncbi:hypothetical protein [Mycobacterium sp.]|uniref:hypothetical protein n=1 Tax=Mycobacterium sp. TaxID=1785 RepID=UPI002D57FC5C|nr:hypothetical protein [Mycobacterium sp.]HZA11590.1 hypothetical protein [Mycobacterium sp.]